MNKILCVLFQASCWEGDKIYHPKQKNLIHLGLLSAIPLLEAFELMCILVGDEAIPLLSFAAAGSIALPATNAESQRNPVAILRS